jgi:hypothetical protein
MEVIDMFFDVQFLILLKQTIEGMQRVEIVKRIS